MVSRRPLAETEARRVAHEQVAQSRWRGSVWRQARADTLPRRVFVLSTANSEDTGKALRAVVSDARALADHSAALHDAPNAT